MSNNIPNQGSIGTQPNENKTTGPQLTRQLPQIPPNSSNINKKTEIFNASSNASGGVATPPPPQPPQRSNLRSTIVRTNSNTSGAEITNRSNVLAQTPTNEWPFSNNSKLANHHEGASSEAAKLVHKSAMAGSIHSLNKPNLVAVQQPAQQSQINAELNPKKHQRNFSLTEKNFASNGQGKLQIQEIAGAASIEAGRLRDGRPSQFNQPISNENFDSKVINNFVPGVLMQSALNQPNLRSNQTQQQISKTTNLKNYNLPWVLISGEEIIFKDEEDQNYCDIMFVLPDNRAIRGKFFISNFRLYFKSDEYNLLSQNQPQIIVDLPLGLVNKIEKVGHKSSYGIHISCKNGRRLRFVSIIDKTSRRHIVELLQRFSFPISNNLQYFAFSYKQTFQDINGWCVYNAKQEYDRLGITQSNDWRYTTINENFQFCDTYPRVLVVPKSVSDEQLRQLGEFRSKKRIPVVSWIKCENKTYGAALLRSSQPLVGLTQKRSDSDEFYLNTIYKLNTNNALDKLFILDARPFVNAAANKTTGGGYESEDHYEKCQICFLNIQNIHVIRQSLNKIYEMAVQSSNNPSAGAANPVNQFGNVINLQAGGVGIGGQQAPLSQQRSVNSAASLNTNTYQNQPVNSNQANNNIFNEDKNYLVNLENSKWLEHIQLILKGVLKIVRYINQHRASVLVHCSDGWDRTAQLTSLSMLCMDKYYRTLRGFQVLIEKEWISFGHRFGIRMGHGSDKHSDQDRSPIFLQFIDCVWQIVRQNSKAFEFNEKLLLAIVQNMYTCQFGTFLYNNECEREKNEVRAKTVSFWSYVNSFPIEFKNSAYTEIDGVVEFSIASPTMQLWTDYYFQYKDNIDDSSQSFITNYTQINRSNTNTNNHASTISNNRVTTYIANNSTVSSTKKIREKILNQVVNQMKSSVRSYSSQEPELIRYRATVTQPEICS